MTTYGYYDLSYVCLLNNISLVFYIRHGNVPIIFIDGRNFVKEAKYDGNLRNSNKISKYTE